MSKFQNSEVVHIAIESHKRSAYDLLNARGKLHYIVGIPKFNHPRFSSEQIFFLNLRSIIESCDSFSIDEVTRQKISKLANEQWQRLRDQNVIVTEPSIKQSFNCKCPKCPEWAGGR